MRLSEERVCSFWKNGCLVVEGILDDQKLDAAGSPLNGFMFEEAGRIAGDSIRPLVTWNESPDITKLSDRVIHLQFHIKDAWLYSFAALN